MKDWTESSFLTDMNAIKQKDAWMFPNLTKSAKLLVTLTLLDINKRSPDRSMFDIKVLGGTFWSYTCNYYMGRLPITDSK